MLSFPIASLVLWALRFLCNCGLNLFSSKVLSLWISWRWQHVCDWNYGICCTDCWNSEWRDYSDERSWCICSCPETAKHTALRIWKEEEQPEENGWRRITSPSPNREIHKDSCVAGVLTIDPPYGPENCNSSSRDYFVPCSGSYSRTSWSFPMRG